MPSCPVFKSNLRYSSCLQAVRSTAPLAPPQTDSPFFEGRVLVVDCISRTYSKDKRRKTQATELGSQSELDKFFKDSSKSSEKPALRIIHVQNADWARDYLLRKYNITRTHDSAKNPFAQWAKYDMPQRRGGKPMLASRAFRVEKDPWRKVWRTGAGYDYLRYFKPEHMLRFGSKTATNFRLAGLNKWEEDPEGNSTSPTHGFDLYVQRLSVYVQRNMTDSGLVDDDYEDLPNPYIRSTGLPDSDEENGTAEKTKPPQMESLVESFDNSNTIIVFESSHTGLYQDTMIQARDEIEQKWRRIWNDMTRDELEEEVLTLECMDLALTYVLSGLVSSWEKFLAKCDDHVSILEDKIYENPADESRAPELWSNSSLWLKIEKLLSVQVATTLSIQEYMRELALDEHDFFRDATDRLRRIQDLIEEELVKPTTNLTDLMYKSVEIRDSRHELQLGTSMWRLSWITFIFLPLTFTVGFFGMNVDTFQAGDGYPSMKWYFIVSVPLMVLVIILYIVLKNTLSIRGEDPLRRGTYENIYSQFATERPELWSRTGPRKYTKPKGSMSWLKWRLICYWFDPQRTISLKPLSDVDDMGFWARFKHRLASSWLQTIDVDTSASITEAGVQEVELGEFGTRVGLMALTPLLMAEGDPRAAQLVADSPFRRSLMRRARSRSRSSSAGSRNRPRPASPGSAVMVCEESTSDDEDRGDVKEEDEDEYQRLREDGNETAERLRRERAESRRIRSESPSGEGPMGLLSVPLGGKRSSGDST